MRGLSPTRQSPLVHKAGGGSWGRLLLGRKDLNHGTPDLSAVKTGLDGLARRELGDISNGVPRIIGGDGIPSCQNAQRTERFEFYGNGRETVLSAQQKFSGFLVETVLDLVEAILFIPRSRSVGERKIGEPEILSRVVLRSLSLRRMLFWRHLRADRVARKFRIVGNQTVGCIARVNPRKSAARSERVTSISCPIR